MDVGKVAPEPTGQSEEVVSYTTAYKSSVSWLSAFATKEIEGLTGKGPKDQIPSMGCNIKWFK